MGEDGGEYDEVGEERLEGWTRESSRHEWRVNYTCLISLAPWCPSSLRGRGIQTRSAGSAPGRGFSLYKSLPRPMVTPTDGSHAGSRRDGGSAPTASTLTSSSTTYTGRTPEIREDVTIFLERKVGFERHPRVIHLRGTPSYNMSTRFCIIRS